jgi:hypothetical protein
LLVNKFVAVEKEARVIDEVMYIHKRNATPRKNAALT